MARRSTGAEPLLYCPFDGGKPKLEDNGSGFCFRYFVICECGVQFPAARTRELAIAHWNRRLKRKPAKRASPLLTRGGGRDRLRN